MLLVHRVTFRPRDLNEHAGAIEEGDTYRIRDQVIEKIQALGTDTKGGEIPESFLLLERGCQELDECLTVCLPPAPGLAALDRRQRVELERGKHLRKRRFDSIREGR